MLNLKGFPSEVNETKWDLILADAPTSYYERGTWRNDCHHLYRGDDCKKREDGEIEVHVHDVNRKVEDKFSMAFI